MHTEPFIDGKTRLNVFLSYARQDARDFAKRLSADLGQNGHQVFLDLTNIESGGLWDVRLEQGIRDSDVLGAVMTLGALREDSVCRDEVVFALNEGKSVIPLKLDPSPNLRPSLLLARRNWIDFSGDYDGGLKSLLRYLAGDPTALRPPPLPTITGAVPLDFGPEVARLTADFTGRKWLESKLDCWLNDSRGRVFVILGEPGIGKSAIAAWLSMIRHDQTVSIHFCTDRNSRTLQPFEFVASLAAQLCTQISGFWELVTLRHPEVRRPNANDAFRELIVEPARALTLPGRPLIVIVDSLDEATRLEGETLVDVLVNQANDLPSWLRIVATSRPDEEVLRRIRRLHTFELAPDAADNISDVIEYTNNRLKKLRLSGQLPEESASVVADRLPKLANGNFLYARLALDELEEGILTPADLDVLSPGMSDFYAKTFAKLFPHEQIFVADAQPMLRALSAAMEPVPFVIIDRASRRQKEDEETTHRRLLRLRSYLRITGKRLVDATYSLFHTSLREWLTDRDAAGFYWCSPELGDSQVAEACWQDYQNDAEEMSEYALRYAMLHLTRVGRDAEAKTLRQDGILRQRRIKLGLGSFFLAYASGDDDLFISKLRRDLTSRGFDLRCEAGDDYDRLVLVGGPKALQSSLIRSEWLDAIDHGKAITTILRDGEFAAIPSSLNQYHVVDARSDARYTSVLAEFVRILGEPPARLAPLFGVPALPPAFVPLPAIIRDLKESILADSAELVPGSIAPVAVSVTVAGMGGVGKTVIAAAFVRDQDVRRAFPDGVFWLTIGQQPDILSLCYHLFNVLGVSIDPGILTIEAAHARLKLLFADLRALIVLDDVWEPTQAAALIGLGAHSRTLLTTRNRGIAVFFGARLLTVDVFAQADATALLSQSAGVSVDALPKEALQLVEELGHHPLALSLAGAMFRHYGGSWEELRDAIGQNSLESLDYGAPYLSKTLTSTIRMSFETLAKNEQECLLELAKAISDSSDLTVPEVAQLWATTLGVTQLKSKVVLNRIQERGLIQVGQGAPERRVSLHPLVHRFLQQLSGNS